MRTKFYILLSVVCILFSCQKNIDKNINTTENSNKNTFIKVQANNNINTRSALEGLNFRWAANDEIRLFAVDEDFGNISTCSALLKIAEKPANGSSYSNSENFSGSLNFTDEYDNVWADNDYIGLNIRAVYPKGDGKVSTGDNQDFFDNWPYTYTFSLPTNQEQEYLSEGVINPESIGKYDYKLAYYEGLTFEEKENITLTFNSVMTLVDFEITNEQNSDLNISKVVFKTDSKILKEKTRFTFDTYEEKQMQTNPKPGKTNMISINLKTAGLNGYNLVSKQSTLVRMTMFPIKITGVITIEVHTNKGIFKVNKQLTDKQFSRAKATKIKLSLSEVNSDDYVDEYGINHGEGKVVQGAIWAPVNFGYHETKHPFGKYYQWGKKDGVSYSGDEVSNTNYDSDWTPSEGLWSTTKTENDPCPKGWRVPSYNELYKLYYNVYYGYYDEGGSDGTYCGDSDNQDKCIFLPFAGYVNSTSKDRETSGKYWCLNKGKCFFIEYYNDEYPLTSDDACSVRCVKE